MTNLCGCSRLFRMPKTNECKQAYLSQFNEFNEHTKQYTHLHRIAVAEYEKKKSIRLGVRRIRKCENEPTSETLCQSLFSRLRRNDV